MIRLRPARTDARLTATRFETPFGPCVAVGDEAGALVELAVGRPGGAEPSPRSESAAGLRWDPGGHAALRRQLGEYFAGARRAFDLDVAPRGTDFQRTVWQRLLAIPFGETRTYGALAAELGRPGASRAVGLANGANPIWIVVPCHRVVGADGSLTGYAGGLDVKRGLLKLEGALEAPQPTLGF